MFGHFEKDFFQEKKKESNSFHTWVHTGTKKNTRNQSYKTFDNLGWCIIKCLKFHFHKPSKKYFYKPSVLKFWGGYLVQNAVILVLFTYELASLSSLCLPMFSFMNGLANYFFGSQVSYFQLFVYIKMFY